MAGLSLREKIERGILRVGEDGQIHLSPLKNPFALKVDAKTDEDIAKEFIELSVKLRELGQSVSGNVVDRKLEKKIKKITERLDELSVALDPVPVESVIQGEEKPTARYFCECCFLEMTWRNGPRNRIEKSEKAKLGELAELSSEELEELRTMSFEELENLRRLVPVEFRKGRDYFAHLPTKGKDFIHERGPGVSLAKDIRNYLELVAHRNGWEFTVLDNKNKGRILVLISNKEKNLKKKFLIAPFGQLGKGDDPQTILITSSQKSGTARRLTIRGLTSSSVDIEATRERIRSGNGDTLLIEDYVQTILPIVNNGKKTPRFQRPPVKLGDAVVEIMRFKAVFVEGTHEIDDFVFSNAPRFSLVDRSDGNAIRKLIAQNVYYADRRRIAKDFLSRNSGLTLEFDDRKEHQPRFGKGLVIFEPKKTKYGKSKTWSPDLQVRKVVLNPYAKDLERFRESDWKDTLVVFHARHDSQAKYQAQQFEKWLEQNNVDRTQIGLVTLHTTDRAKVRGSMFAFLKQPEIPFEDRLFDDFDGSPFADPTEIDVAERTEVATRNGEVETRSRGTSRDEPEHISTLFDELGLEEPTGQQGITPSTQRFIDHETGMDRLK